MTSESPQPEPAPSRLTVWVFRGAFTCALLVSATTLFFLVWGLIDGSVSSFNGTLWLALSALVVVVPVLGWRLRAQGRLRAGITVLSVLAVPGLLYLLFLLLVVATGASWN